MTSYQPLQLHQISPITSIMLGRPTDTSITVSIIASTHLEAFIEYGLCDTCFDRSTRPFNLSSEKCREIEINNLAPDKRYWYRLHYRKSPASRYAVGQTGTFNTQRREGSKYRFTITADSHIVPKAFRGDSASIALYSVTLANVAADSPDFNIDLGDFAHSEFYAGRNAESAKEAYNRYLFERYLLAKLTNSVPFYLVLGNHEGEQGWRRLNDSDSLEIWGTIARKQLIPNPYPNHFYTGNTDATACCGLREDYYAWQWGDALFVVLDPFWYTTRKPHLGGGQYPGTGNGWDWTLGKQQYEWLYQTLHSSDAKWKFVFCHHLVGGLLVGKMGKSAYGRGGIDAVSHKVAGNPTFEWGGEDSTGRYVFDEKRPGWEHGPIHQILVNEGVDIVFRGHDHAFVYEKLDGIVYQTCPQPSDASYGRGVSGKGIFKQGTVFNNSGHVRVIVSPDSVRVEYVRAVRPEDEPLSQNGKIIENRSVSFSYTLKK